MKIKVLSLFWGECPYRKIFERNVGEYCGRYGYELIINDRHKTEYPFFKEQWAHFLKQLVILNEIHDCDYLLWIDMDCIILNMATPLERYFGLNDIVMSFEEHPETGMILFKNTEWTRDFLFTWLRAELDNESKHHHLDNQTALCFSRTMRNKIAEGKIYFMSPKEFCIKHVHILEKTEDTLAMHVPGSTMEDKVIYMEKHLNDVIR